jgi:hypothetical protein
MFFPCKVLPPPAAILAVLLCGYVVSWLAVSMYVSRNNIQNSLFFDGDKFADIQVNRILQDHVRVRKELSKPEIMNNRKFAFNDRSNADIAFCITSVPRTCPANVNVLERTVDFLRYSLIRDIAHCGSNLRPYIGVYNLINPAIKKRHETAELLAHRDQIDVKNVYSDSSTKQQSSSSPGKDDDSVEENMQIVHRESRDYFQSMYDCTNGFNGKYVVMLEDDVSFAPNLCQYLQDVVDRDSSDTDRVIYTKLFSSERFEGFENSIQHFALHCFVFFFVSSTCATIFFLFMGRFYMQRGSITECGIVSNTSRSGSKTTVRQLKLWSLAVGILTAAWVLLMLFTIGKPNVDHFFGSMFGLFPPRSRVLADKQGVMFRQLRAAGTQALMFRTHEAKRLSEDVCTPGEFRETGVFGNPRACAVDRTIDFYLFDLSKDAGLVSRVYYPSIVQHAGLACSSLGSKKNVVFSESFHAHFGESGADVATSNVSHVAAHVFLASRYFLVSVLAPTAFVCFWAAVRWYLASPAAFS